MSSSGKSEKRSLLDVEKDQMMTTIRGYSATNNNASVQHTDDTPAAKGFDQVSRHSAALSVDGLENASLLGSMVPPQDLQELMGNLEKATLLVKRYLENNQGMDFGARKPTKRPLIPRLITNYLLVITFLWQAINIGLIEGIDRIQENDGSAVSRNVTTTKVSIVSNIVMTVFQLVHIIVVFFVSFKLVKQVMHGTASGSLLAQAYLSTVLLFAGLYTLEYRFDRKGWSNVVDSAIRSELRSDSDSDIIATLLFLRMLYFSISTGTLCGTSAIEPIAWYGGLTVSLQMLMSFVYFTSILSIGLRMITRKQGSKRDGRSLTKKIRECVFRERSRSNREGSPA